MNDSTLVCPRRKDEYNSRVWANKREAQFGRYVCMTSYPENTLLIWAHPSLTHDALEHVANHRLLKELRYPCTAPGHLAAQVFLGAATGELSWETALTGLHSREGYTYPGQLNRYGHMQCPACQLSPTGFQCGQHDCGTPDCWRLVTDGGRIQWYSSQILNDVGGEASEADSPEWLRKLLLATGCPSLPGGRTEPSAPKGSLPPWQTPLFCLSSESGKLFRSIWGTFNQAWAAERAWRVHTFATERAEAEAKEAFARREGFQLHFLLAHPGQPAQASEASSAQKRVAFFDGKLQDGGIRSPYKAAGRPSQSARSAPALSAGAAAGAGGSSSAAAAPQPPSVKAEQDAEPMASPAAAEGAPPASGERIGPEHLSAPAQPDVQPALPAGVAQSAHKQGPPSPAHALLRTLQQVQSGATRVSPEVIRAAIQLTNTSCHDVPAGTTAWARPAAKQPCEGHAATAPVTLQPADQAPAPQPAQAWAGHAPTTSSPESGYSGASAAAAAQRDAQLATPARHSWLFPPRKAAPPPTQAAQQRPSAPVNLHMLQPRFVRVATAAGLGPRSGGLAPAPQRTQPPSASGPVAPATLPIPPVVSRPPHSITPVKAPLLPIRLSVGQDGVAIGVPVAGANSRPVDIAAARVAHAVCRMPQISKSLARRQRSGMFPRPVPEGSASAEPEVAAGQQGVQGMCPQTPSVQLGVPGGQRRAAHPGEMLSTVSSLSPPPANKRSLHDYVPGLIPHGDQVSGKRPLLDASVSLPKRQNQAVPAGLQQSGSLFTEALAIMPSPHPEVPPLPGLSLSPGPPARKRARPCRFESDNAFRPKPSPGRPRVAHPDCTPPPGQAAGKAAGTSPSVQIIGASPTLSPVGRKRGRPKVAGSSTSRSPVLLSGSPSEAGALTHFRAAGGSPLGSPLGSPEARKRGRPKGSRNAPVGVRLAADMARRSLGPLARPDLTNSPRPRKPPQELGWLAYARSRGVDYNEAQLRKQKWSAAGRVVKKAMRHRRAAVQARDSAACGDCTQALLRMMPGQGMSPDGSAGFSMLELCKAVLAGGAGGARASLRLAALTLEDIQARMGALAQQQAAASAAVPKPVRAAQRLLQLECDRLAACLPSALARRASAGARTPRKPLSPCKLALLVPDGELPCRPSGATAPPASATTVTELEQEGDDGKAAVCVSPDRLPAMAVGGQLHGTPPGTPQQLRAAVVALTDQLDSAKKSLMTCVASPAAQRQLDASLARCAEPVQALLARQRHRAPHPSHELAGFWQDAGAASAAAVTVLTTVRDGTQDTSQASSMQQQPSMSAADTAERSTPGADLSKDPAASAAYLPPAMPDLSAAMTLLQIGRGVGSGCSNNGAAEDIAAYSAAPTVAATEATIKHTLDGKGLSMSQAPEPSRPGTPAPQVLAQAAVSGHETSAERCEKDIAVPRIPGSPGQRSDGAAAHCSAKTGAGEDRPSAGGLQLRDGGSTSAADAGEAAICNAQNAQRKVETATLTSRDISPEFGEQSQEGEGVLGRVMDTVGKLCRDIDPMQAHAPSSDTPQSAVAARADPQAATMLAEADGIAKAGAQRRGAEGVQRPGKSADARRMEDSAHASEAELSQNAAAAGACKEGCKAAEHDTADDRSTGSAGSWQTCPETVDALHPEDQADAPLTVSGALGKPRSADEALSSGLPGIASSMQPATSALLGTGQHTGKRKSARAASRAPSRSEKLQAEHSTGGKLSRMAQAVPSQPQGTKATMGASFQVLISSGGACDGDSKTLSGSPAGARTNVNTPLTPGCIFGPHRARKTAVWKKILGRT